MSTTAYTASKYRRLPEITMSCPPQCRCCTVGVYFAQARRKTCAICGETAAKYTCPRCAVRTCSLAVCASTTNTGCNGSVPRQPSSPLLNTNHSSATFTFGGGGDNAERTNHLNNVVGSTRTTSTLMARGRGNFFASSATKQAN